METCLAMCNPVVRSTKNSKASQDLRRAQLTEYGHLERAIPAVSRGKRHIAGSSSLHPASIERTRQARDGVGSDERDRRRRSHPRTVDARWLAALRGAAHVALMTDAFYRSLDAL